MDNQQTGKIILITGAGRGIGLEVGRQLAQAGHTIVAGIRGQIRPPTFPDANRWVPIPLDVTLEQDILRAVEAVDQKFGRLDALINNAGIGIGNRSLENADIEEIRSIFDVNFFGPLRINRAFLPLLRKSNDARIINVSSKMGALSDLTSGYAGYRLSKAGLNTQTILLANEVESEGIKVVAVCPGWVKTDMGGTGAPKSVEEGADGIVWLVTEPGVRSGKFYSDRKIVPW